MQIKGPCFCGISENITLFMYTTILRKHFKKNWHVWQYFTSFDSSYCFVLSLHSSIVRSIAIYHHNHLTKITSIKTTMNIHAARETQNPQSLSIKHEHNHIYHVKSKYSNNPNAKHKLYQKTVKIFFFFFFFFLKEPKHD